MSACRFILKLYATCIALGSSGRQRQSASVSPHSESTSFFCHWVPFARANARAHASLDRRMGEKSSKRRNMANGDKGDRGRHAASGINRRQERHSPVSGGLYPCELIRTDQRHTATVSAVCHLSGLGPCQKSPTVCTPRRDFLTTVRNRCTDIWENMAAARTPCRKLRNVCTHGIGFLASAASGGGSLSNITSRVYTWDEVSDRTQPLTSALAVPMARRGGSAASPDVHPSALKCPSPPL